MSGPLVIAIVVAVGVVVGTAISSAVNYVSNRNRTPSQNRLDDSSAALNVSAAYKALLEEKDSHIVALSDRVTRLESERTRLTGLEQIQRETRARVGALEAEREKWVKEREEWKAGIVSLIAQLETMEIKPVWKPKTGPFGK